MSLGLFLAIVVLIVINAIVRNMVKCLHDKFCVLCKKDACCK
jgi:hypothetical protein